MIVSMKHQRHTVPQVREADAPTYVRAARSASAALAHIDPTLHARVGGNLDARRIAHRLGVPPKRLAEAVGYTPQGLLKNPTSDKLQPALAEIAFILSHLRSLLDGERSVAMWLRAPHPDLGGATPLSFILSRRIATIRALLHLAESGQPS